MTVCGRLSLPNTTANRAAGKSDRAPLVRDRGASTSPSGDLAEADQLISDLAVLLDAGLVVVQEHVLGPARYGAVSIAG
jgi:hypothetical protein